MATQNAQATAPDLEQLSALFKLLSEPTRLNILMLLSSGERNVTSLCEALALPQPTVSHHLGLLRNHSVVSNRRAGKQMFYSLGDIVDGLENGQFNLAASAYVIKIASRSTPA